MCKNLYKLVLVLIIGLIAFKSIPVYAYEYKSLGDQIQSPEIATPKKQNYDIKTYCSTITAEYDFSCRNENIRNAVDILANLIFLAKIIIPVVIVLIGIISFGKSIIAQDDSDIKQLFIDLLKKVILGVLIFFIPTIIVVIAKGTISGYTASDLDSNSWVCCIDLLK